MLILTSLCETYHWFHTHVLCGLDCDLIWKCLRRSFWVKEDWFNELHQMCLLPPGYLTLELKPNHHSYEEYYCYPVFIYDPFCSLVCRRLSKTWRGWIPVSSRREEIRWTRFILKFFFFCVFSFMCVFVCISSSWSSSSSSARPADSEDWMSVNCGAWGVAWKLLESPYLSTRGSGMRFNSSSDIWKGTTTKCGWTRNIQGVLGPL